MSDDGLYLPPLSDSLIQWPDIPINLPSYTPYNLADVYAGADSSSGFDANQLLQLIQGGVNAYGQIEAINKGGYQNYSVPGQGLTPQQQQAATSSQDGSVAPADPGSGTGFDWSKLTDFSTPYPYAAGIGGLLLLTIIIIMRAARR